MDILNKIYETIYAMDSNKAAHDFLYKHFNIRPNTPAYREFKAGFDLWKCVEFSNIEKMREWEKKTGRGIYKQQ